MINSLFDRCLIDMSNFVQKEQQKPSFRGFYSKYLLHRCLITKVSI
jgi:hypothetical protein